LLKIDTPLLTLDTNAHCYRWPIGRVSFHLVVAAAQVLQTRLGGNETYTPIAVMAMCVSLPWHKGRSLG